MKSLKIQRVVLQVGMLLSTFVAGQGIILAEDNAPRTQVDVLVGFEVFSRDFLDKVGVEQGPDGLVHLSEIEAFFLLCREHQAKDANWPPKRHAIVFGKSLRAQYAGEGMMEDYSLQIVPTREEGDTQVSVTIEANQDSAFVLKKKLKIDMPNRSVIYLPSQKLLADDKQLYLVLQVDTGEEE